MVNISSDVIRGYNDTIILYLLWDKPSYGYEISKQIKLISEEKYVIKETTLYSAFTRLEKTATSHHSPAAIIRLENAVPTIRSQMPEGNITA